MAGSNIRVTTPYRGIKTNEQVILEGVYNPKDRRLFGLGEFLVQTGRAHTTSEEAMPIESVIAETAARVASILESWSADGDPTDPTDAALEAVELDGEDDPAVAQKAVRKTQQRRKAKATPAEEPAEEPAGD